jgi:hypothetical protein
LGGQLSRGQWLWLWQPQSVFSNSDVEDVLDTLSRWGDSHHVVWLQPPGDVSRGLKIAINDINNGLRPAADSLLWKSELLTRWGTFDPHLAVGSEYTAEFIWRIIRWVRITALPVRDGTPAAWMPDRMRSIALYVTSRLALPRPETLPTYALDDLTQVERRHGVDAAWQLYLDWVLPFYYAQRHRLPPSLFISPQSVPRATITALLTKNQYETSNELNFANYDRYARGDRQLLLSYLQSRLITAPARGDLEISTTGHKDVVVAVRTADDANADLLEQAKKRGAATAYMLDDDLLTFHEYGGNFASFAPGHPNYEAMLRTIRTADVVIGFGEQIRKSVTPHNPRYVHSENSVPLELLPDQPRPWPAGKVVHFAYAGGGYRTEEFKILRSAIQRIIAEYGETVRFSFWGLDPETVNLSGNVDFQPFSTHYLEYLERLRAAEFDAMLVPLMLDPAPKRAKNANKFMEAAIADAIGLYSDVPTYAVVQDGFTGFRWRTPRRVGTEPSAP